MAWFRIQLTEEQQQVVNEERSAHPNPRAQEKMLALWLLHNGLTRENAAKIVGISRATIQRYVAAFREGGLEGLRRWDPNRPISEMAGYRELIRESFEKQPVHTIRLDHECANCGRTNRGVSRPGGKSYALARLHLLSSQARWNNSPCDARQG
jgi:Homeodomain-like domain